MKPPLQILSCGVCCSVGYSTEAALAALRVGMDHFQESPYRDRNGEPINVARLPLEDVWGPRRTALLARNAMAGCRTRLGRPLQHQTMLLLLVAERGRPHTEDEHYQAAYAECTGSLQGFHPESRIVTLGRGGLAPALNFAHRQLLSRKTPEVMLVAVDTLLNAAHIEVFLAQERLLTSEVSSGFIPGEGAGAVLLTLADEQKPGLRLLGLGYGTEAARLDGEIPNRAQGMSQAMRQALESARIAPARLDFRMSDENGEPFFSREAATALTRVMGADSVRLPLITVADSIGHTGTAASTIMLALAAEIMARGDGPGITGLLHTANATGERSAVVMQHLS